MLFENIKNMTQYIFSTIYCTYIYNSSYVPLYVYTNRDEYFNYIFYTYIL